MKSEYLEIRADWNGVSWVIRDIGNPRGGGLRVEALVMRATRTGEGFAQGYIVAVHGLDQEVARELDNASLKLLGVGAHLRPQSVAPKGAKTRRVNLTLNGKITGGTM